MNEGPQRDAVRFHAVAGAVRGAESDTRDEDGAYVAECPAIPGCVSQGTTEEEAQANVREAIRTLRSLIARAGLTVEEFLAQR